ncbi:MAG: FtsW/RodA/SpoVE family cell cycle protein [Bacteroidia bacterium]
MNFPNAIKGDKTIWLIVLALSLFSTLVVYSSSVALAYKYKDGHSEYFLFKHSFLTIVGLIITYYIHNIKITPNHFNLIGTIGMIITFPLLIFTIFSGVRSGEAARWIEVPGLGITFQSSDIAKIVLILFISRNLAFVKFSSFKSIFWYIVVPVALICIPIFIVNFSTSFLLALTIFYLLLLSNIQTKYVLKLVMYALILAITTFTLIYFFPNILPRGKTWKARIENFKSNDSKTNYQAEQAKIAIANGGLIGKGPGNSAQRAFLPQASSDFIYSILIEEYGTMSGLLVLFAFLIIFFRCIRIIQKSKNIFYSYIVAGLSFNLVLQAFINMSVAVNLLPVTGQPLPFISMGGTSLIFSCISIGIILNISKQINADNQTELKKEKHQPIMDTNNIPS